MRVLICTQKVDRDDDVLGFMHGWLNAFAKVFSEVSVIALGVGEYSLPANVRVFSLGKERGVGHVGYIVNFYKTLWRLRGQYDAVLVHMNTEYALLGGLFWLLARKSLFLWYNHKEASLTSRTAFLFPKRIFYTSPFAATSRFKKAVRMPVGVDTEVFRRLPDIAPKSNTILFLGRLSPVKKLDVLLDALAILSEKGVPFSLNVYGNTSERDAAYAASARARAEAFGDRVVFRGPVSNSETPSIYNAHAVYVNLTSAGSFDKTIIEAMACGTPAIVSNESLHGEVPDMFIVKQDDSVDLARTLERVLTGAKEYRGAGEELRAYAVKHHALVALSKRLKDTIFP